jgi:hypothetical protein
MNEAARAVNEQVEENKTLLFKGKNNIYKINQAVFGNKRDQTNSNIREKMKNLKEDIKQIELINRIYLGIEDDKSGGAKPTDTDAYYMALVKQELENKRNGYKQQDIKKNIYNMHLLITFDEMVEKLVISKLKCSYCSIGVLLLYKNVREPCQWTLDRKYNDDCHSNENTLISCLKCNLERRVKNIDKFTFTKKLRIKKEM